MHVLCNILLLKSCSTHLPSAVTICKAARQAYRLHNDIAIMLEAFAHVFLNQFGRNLETGQERVTA